jgi:hypothetical protein
MKRFLAVSFVFVLGCVAGGVASQLAVAPARAQAPNAHRWEYNCGVDPSLAQLDEAGSQGWELVAIAPYRSAASGHLSYCFKRSLQ